MNPIVIVGAGIGGLVTATRLARDGAPVIVLEAHVYPGGCAGTFYHQGYRFDAGATLAGGFAPGGPMDQVARAIGLEAWKARPCDPAMVVHLPQGVQVRRWVEANRWREERRRLDPQAEGFWRWQEQTAERVWRLAQQLPAWPPRSPGQLSSLARLSVEVERPTALPSLMLDGVLPVGHRLQAASQITRLLVDAQLLISAQTTSGRANALFAAAALDLPQRGVVQFAGGMGTLARQLAEQLQRLGGTIHYRQRVTRVRPLRRGSGHLVETSRGLALEAAQVVFNLPPANIESLLAGPTRRPKSPDWGLPGRDAWGAFCLYLGIDGRAIPDDLPLHHQIILAEPLGEGNTTFLSLSPVWDPSRAPSGQRALTLSTHTLPRPWWELSQRDPAAFEARVEQFTDRLLEAAEIALPGIRSHLRILLPATPLTFERFTSRAGGWVGGYPQTQLLRFAAPRIGRGLHRVGDSIFPGQSTAAVALGALRVAQLVRADAPRSIPRPRSVPVPQREPR